MAKILTGLIPALLQAMDTVSREQIGVVPASLRNAVADSVAIGQTLSIPVALPRETVDISPGNPPTDTGTDFSHVDVKMQKMKAVRIDWTGDEEATQRSVLANEKRDEITQAMRALANEMERDLALCGVAAGISAGNVYGTVGTTPFSGSLADMANVRRKMNEMGAPIADRQFVANTVAAASLLSLTNLTNAEKAGGDTELRQGIIRPLMGFNVWESGGLTTISPGSGAGYLVNGAASARAKEINIDTGSGQINKGAIVTFGSDTDTKYAVIEDVLTGGTVLKIAGGLKTAIADNAAVNVQTGDYLPSLAFNRNALLFVCRPPYQPEGGDESRDTQNFVDPVSGLAFQASVYPGYRKTSLEIASCWGWAAVSPRHICTLYG